MKRIIPQAVQECNVFINGQGYLGVTKTLKLPTMEFETIEAKGALSANYSSGILAATEVSFTIRIADRNTWLAMGLNAFSSRVPFLFTASIYQASGEPKPFSAAFTGDITKRRDGSYDHASSALCRYQYRQDTDGVKRCRKYDPNDRRSGLYGESKIKFRRVKNEKYQSEFTYLRRRDRGFCAERKNLQSCFGRKDRDRAKHKTLRCLRQQNPGADRGARYRRF